VEHAYEILEWLKSQEGFQLFSAETLGKKTSRYLSSAKQVWAIELLAHRGDVIQVEEGFALTAKGRLRRESTATQEGLGAVLNSGTEPTLPEVAKSPLVLNALARDKAVLLIDEAVRHWRPLRGKDSNATSSAHT
jgi:hypothetical protein